MFSAKVLETVVTGLALAAVTVYRLVLSPILPVSCRFEPTCSAYAVTAIKRHGLRGLGLAALRVGRCHPFHPGGLDPVPEPKTPR
ncbi:MAG: membrane protein insertion efficiency factor YidD [Pseudomonadota bacterium]